MPIYEYGCESCGHTLEVTQKMADPKLTTCPSCGKESLEKLISATAFVLKGGGWYKDGYSSTSGTKRSDNTVTDRLTKAITDDKKKTGGDGGTSGSSGGSSSSGSTGGSSTPAASSGGASSSGGSAASSTAAA